MLSELLYADDLVLINVTVKGLRNKLIDLKDAFESEGFKVYLWKAKVIVSSGITKIGMCKSEVDPSAVCSLRVKANSVLCLQCGKWIHGRCAGVKRVTPSISRNFACRKCEGNIGVAVEQEEKLCDEVETVSEFTYLCDRVSAIGECEAAVNARTRCG